MSNTKWAQQVCVCFCLCVCVTITEEEAMYLKGGMGRVAGEEEDGSTVNTVFRYEILKKLI